MSLPTVIAATGPFLKLVGEVLADLKRQELADIDIAFLDLQRSKLADGLRECQAKVQEEVVRRQAQARQDFISRGLGNTTVVDSALRAIEQDAANELSKAMLEHNRALEEIALRERQVRAQSRSSWRRFLGWFRWRPSSKAAPAR